MSLLSTLAQYLAGEFDNREQAIENPVWFVHLCLWHRPVNLFTDDSFTIFAEQANILKLDQPYRQRLLRLSSLNDTIVVQYYMFKNSLSVKGAGQTPELLNQVSEADVERLPGCTLQVITQTNQFIATPPPDARCCFSVEGSTIRVSLGFEASVDRFLSYDKGLDPETEQPIWGALMGAYEFTKRQQF